MAGGLDAVARSCGALQLRRRVEVFEATTRWRGKQNGFGAMKSWSPPMCCFTGIGGKWVPVDMEKTSLKHLRLLATDYSDSDGSLKDPDSVQSSKDLCQADPKSFSSQWTILLPTNDVLRPRKFEATLMTCLLFDPYLKARMASASTLAAMMDGPSSIFLQVAEYKESSKYGSFMALSSSLGQILMQLHNGIIYLIQRESHHRLLTSLFKILMLLISCTPYESFFS
ncbi:uncharacterized protein LOC116146912 [Pistacia vera]|uniref:uncharacterized protein LOC116146912 n=1 Tax=Pistacia vera TaxID=55513 RepID=UPI0012639D49|nr:uncharacterized protein LOC116146912 [Pistacia vera]